MADVKVLIKGFYDTKKGNGWSTCTLITEGKTNIVVDPGTVKDQREITRALKREGLGIKDVDIVAITHSHLDHYRNIGMFPQAKSLDRWGLWKGDSLVDIDMIKKFSEDIEIINTPGHSDDAITFLVKTKKGIIAVCGDVFWRKGYPKKDPYANDLKTLAKSRKRVLKIADYIIPGHDGMYATGRAR